MTKKDVATTSERIARAREANRQAQFDALLKTGPLPDPKPQGREGYFGGHYTGLTWRGKKIIIPKGRQGW
jgi:hypothetical protein